MSAGTDVGHDVGSTVAGFGSTLIAYLKPLVVLVVLWELVATLQLVPEQALPHTYAVWDTLVALAADGALVRAAWQTVYRAMAAFALSIVIGVSVGLAMSEFRPIEWFFDPIVSFGFPVPKVTLVPIYVLWFGFGTLPAVLLGTTSATFPIVIATHAGAKKVDRELIWSARSMGISRFRMLKSVILPSALPEIFNGVQISLFLSFVVVVVAEMVTSAGGLGEMLTRSVRFFQTPTAIAAVITIAVIGLVIDRLFRVLRAHLLQWTD